MPHLILTMRAKLLVSFQRQLWFYHQGHEFQGQAFWAQAVAPHLINYESLDEFLSFFSSFASSIKQY